jgi:hypothetical protein
LKYLGKLFWISRMSRNQFSQSLKAVIDGGLSQCYQIQSKCYKNIPFATTRIKVRKLTNIDESARSTFAELLGFVRKSHFNYTWNVPSWSLDANGM